MAVSLPTDSLHLIVPSLPLSRDGFLPFGDVLGAPLAHDDDATMTSANQGTALRSLPPGSQPVDLYAHAPSQRPAQAVVSQFASRARTLEPDPDAAAATHLFPVHILERHPFTTQTFVPLATAPLQSRRYLVVVAPSLPPSAADAHFPVPSLSGAPAPGRGLPDLRRLVAFVAHQGQAVTYAAGTWHSPMVVLPSGSAHAQEFFVLQYANGVAAEDCQEAVLQGSGRVAVRVSI